MIGAVLLGAFAWWELRTDHPMLDVTFFKNPRFTAASAAITLTFFAMFGSLFVFTQYLQFVLGYTPLQTGVRLLAFAVPMMIIAPLSARLVERSAPSCVVAAGMILTTAGLVLLSFCRRRHHLRRNRVADGRHRLRPGSHHGPRHRVDHGLAAPGQGWRRLGRQRHHPSGRRRGRRRRNRQRLHVDLRLSVAAPWTARPCPRTSSRKPRTRSAPRSDAAAESAGRGEAGATIVRPPAFMDGFHAALRVGALVAIIGVVITLVWLPARARPSDVDS